jgi:hypothetical protein
MVSPKCEKDLQIPNRVGLNSFLFEKMSQNDSKIMITSKRLEHEFVCRRVFRGPEGLVRRSDLIEAFGVSSSKATRIVAAEVEAHGLLLVRDGYLVRRRLGAQPPAFASMRDLMDKLDAGLSDFKHTGLRPEELPVNSWQWCENMPQSEEAMELVVQACVQQRGVLINYVGMRRGETGTWRRIAPLCLERMGDQWRVTAQDLEKPGSPLRTYVLARIIDAKPDIAPMPRKFIRASPDDSQSLQNVEFSLKLSGVQRKVLERELKIQNGQVTLPRRCVHEFMIRFADGARSDDIAWPPLRARKSGD